VMPWDSIQAFLWCYTKCAEKKKVSLMPKFTWNFSEQNTIILHARKKLQAIEL